MYILVLYFGIKMSVTSAVQTEYLTSYESCQELAMQLKSKLPVRLGPVRWECKRGFHVL